MLQVSNDTAHGYVYRNWSHIPPDPSDLESNRRDKLLHPFAQRLPTKLSAMLSNQGKTYLLVVIRMLHISFLSINSKLKFYFFKP